MATNPNASPRHSADERMDALIKRVASFDDRPATRLLTMLETVFTTEQWDALEATVQRREESRGVMSDAAGIAWWNRLTREQRRYWLEVAGSARPVDAWRAYQQGLDKRVG